MFDYIKADRLCSYIHPFDIVLDNYAIIPEKCTELSNICEKVFIETDVLCRLIVVNELYENI